MNAITLHEPFATLIGLGVKRYETRGWPTPVRGPIAIHAGKSLPEYAADILRFDLTIREVFQRHGVDPRFGLPDAALVGGVWAPEFVEAWEDSASPTVMLRKTKGCVIAVAELVDCVRFDRDFARQVNDEERAFGDFTPGRYGFQLANVRRLPEPIPARGQQMFWEWTPPAGLLDGIAA